MPEKNVSTIDWKDNRDVEIVRLNLQCMAMAIELTDIFRQTAVPVDAKTPFVLANKIYRFVTFTEAPEPPPPPPP